MSTSHKEFVGMLVTAMALSVMALLVLPSIAEAQEDAPADPAGDVQSTNQDATTILQPAASDEPAVRPVVRGDSLWSIAQERLGPEASPQQTANEVERIYGLNRELIGDDPNLLLPGQKLSLAQRTEPTAHPVVRGDSLWSIAQERLGPNATPGQTMDEVERIYELNRELIGDDPNLLLAGQELLLAQRTEPAADASATEFPTTTTTTTAEEPATAKRPEPKDEPAPEQANGWTYSTLTLLLSFGLFLFALAVAVLGVWKLLRTKKLLKERYERYYGNYDRLRHPEEREADEPAPDTPAPDPPAEGSRTSKRIWSAPAVAGLTLLTAILTVLLAGRAEAQQEPVDAYTVSTEITQNANQNVEDAATASQAAHEPAERLVVVEPGDSLWAIAQERLQPNATPQQIATEVERIYELNRNQIGNDPNLIFPGQELLLPAVYYREPAATAVSGPAVSEQVRGSAVPERLPEPATQEQIPEEATQEQVPEPISGPIAPLDLPASEEEAAPAAIEIDVLSPSTEPYAIDRKLAGLGIIVLTVCLAILMAWKLPMKRAVEPPMVWRRPYTRRKVSVVPTSRSPAATTPRRPSSSSGGDRHPTNDKSDSAPTGRSIGEKVGDSKRRLRTSPLSPRGNRRWAP